MWRNAHDPRNATVEAGDHHGGRPVRRVGEGAEERHPPSVRADAGRRVADCPARQADGSPGPGERNPVEMRAVRLPSDEPADDDGPVAAGQRIVLLEHDLAAQEPRGGERRGPDLRHGPSVRGRAAGATVGSGATSASGRRYPLRMHDLLVAGLRDRLTVAPEVADALRAGRPVVALESTLISHGLPFPCNLEVAGAAEAAVRESGAVPATVGIRDGRLVVGLDAPALVDLATADGVWKVARPTLAGALAAGVLGATTVSATMLACAAAGIRVFATGGIGGGARQH